MEDGARSEVAAASRSTEERPDGVGPISLARLRARATALAASPTAARPRVTRLGVLLRRLRRRAGESLLTMAQRIGAQDLGLAPETLAAVERGDAAPPARFWRCLETAYDLPAQEREEFEQALFIAADPFLLQGAEAAGDETAEEALRTLKAPIEELFDDAAPASAALLVRRHSAGPAEFVQPSDEFETVCAAAGRLRRAVADADGRVSGEALTDGVELLLQKPVRVIFADAPLSAALFGGARDGEISFSGPVAAASRAGGEGAAELAPSPAPNEDGGYVCLRAGLLARLVEGDPIARFALLHELGHRVAGHPETPFFSERMAKDPKLVATPHFRRRGVSRDRLQRAIGAPQPGQADAAAGVRLGLTQEANANLFALLTLAEPREFSPAVDQLDRWAAHYGLPFAAALAFLRQAPDLFGAGGGARVPPLRSSTNPQARRIEPE